MIRVPDGLSDDRKRVLYRLYKEKAYLTRLLSYRVCAEYLERFLKDYFIFNGIQLDALSVKFDLNKKVWVVDLAYHRIRVTKIFEKPSVNEFDTSVFTNELLYIWSEVLYNTLKGEVDNYEIFDI